MQPTAGAINEMREAADRRCTRGELVLLPKLPVPHAIGRYKSKYGLQKKATRALVLVRQSTINPRVA